jgi:hypothetical protein
VPVHVRGQDVIAIYRQKDGERRHCVMRVTCVLERGKPWPRLRMGCC